MRIARTPGVLASLMGSLLLIGGIAGTASADSTSREVNLTKSRSPYLMFSETTEAPRKLRPQDRRIRLRYDQAVQVGGSDVIFRLKAPLKKKKLLAFEVIF